jgi:hypothetical protein
MYELSLLTKKYLKPGTGYTPVFTPLNEYGEWI